EDRPRDPGRPAGADAGRLAVLHRPRDQPQRQHDHRPGEQAGVAQQAGVVQARQHGAMVGAFGRRGAPNKSCARRRARSRPGGGRAIIATGAAWPSHGVRAVVGSAAPAGIPAPRGAAGAPGSPGGEAAGRRAPGAPVPATPPPRPRTRSLLESGMSIVIRDVQEHELDSILALNNAAGPTILPLDAARIRKFYDSAEYFRVAERDGTLAGFLVGMGSDADHDSSNFHWFRAHCERFFYI